MSKLRNYFFVLSGLLAMSCTEKLDDKPGFAGEGQEAMVSISINTVPEVMGIPGSLHRPRCRWRAIRVCP